MLTTTAPTGMLVSNYNDITNILNMDEHLVNANRQDDRPSLAIGLRKGPLGCSEFM
jgi:hypothetical protein